MIGVRLNEIGLACAALLAVASYHNVISLPQPTLSNVISGTTTGTPIVNSTYFFNGNLTRIDNDRVLFIGHDGNDDAEEITGDGWLSKQIYTISANSWGSISTVYDPGVGKNCIPAHTVSRGDGEIWCFFTEIVSGSMSAGGDIKIIKSYDYGETWGSPVTLKSLIGFSQPSKLITFANNPNKLHLHIAGYANPKLQIIESLDDGATWPTTITVYSGAKSLSEIGVVNIDDTNMIALIRDDAGDYLLISKSTDGGQTWSAPASTGIGAATGQKVQPRIGLVAGRHDYLYVLFYDRGDNRFKWGTVKVSDALNNTWSAPYLLGTGARGYGDICVIDEANQTYLVTNDKEISGSQCDRLWWRVKDIYANSIYPAPFY